MKKLLLLFALLFCSVAPTLAATCSGGAFCRACENCGACGHCAKRGGTCSVCRPDLFRSTGATTAPRVYTSPRPYTAPAYRPPSYTPRYEPKQPAIQTAKTFRAKVIGVTDGDTVAVLWQGRSLKVRLSGIDAPEKSQPHGNQAKKFTSSLCFGKMITVHSYGLDRYGRVLGWIQFEDGRWLNNEIVKAGYAWWYRQYEPNNPRMAAQEAAARKARRGLWADAHPVAPWEYRRAR